MNFNDLKSRKSILFFWNGLENDFETGICCATFCGELTWNRFDLESFLNKKIKTFFFLKISIPKLNSTNCIILIFLCYVHSLNA